jgi:hypothetical protein
VKQWTEQLRGPIQRTDLATMVGGRMDWINLVKNGDQWWMLVNMVVKFGFHKSGNFLTS